MGNEIDALIAKCAAATGGDRELDGLMAKQLRESGEYGAYEFYEPEPYTSSIDSIVALVERELPGAGWCLYSTGTPVHAERYWARILSVKDRKMKRTASPALALCQCFLKALRAKCSIDGDGK
jgi:hypothetical protein